MIKTIKGKISVGVLLISISVFIIINVIIWKVFQNNLQKFIINDMDKMKTIIYTEMKRNYIIGNKIDYFKNNSKLWTTLNEINKQFDVYVSIDYDIDNNLWFSGNLLNENQKKDILKDSRKISSIIYINNEKNKFYATYVYPMYIEYNYTAALVFQKDYIKEYKHYVSLMIQIIVVQIVLFIMMIFIIYLWLNKVTKSLKLLSEGMTYIGKGDFSSRLEAKGKDEAAKLIFHFNDMQEKIVSQMEEIQFEKKKIQELERTTRDFFNYATHEMKTPIAAILGYTQLLQKGNMDSQIVERAYGRIVLESKRMNSMVQNMLVVARGKETEKHIPEVFNFKELLTKVVEEFELVSQKNKKDIYIECEEGMIFAVKEEIRRILTNLIENSIKYSVDRKIHIKCECKDRIYVTIENKCAPFPDEIKYKLLEPFTKYNFGDNKQVSSGLGLFICKELAEKNNGSIDYTIHDDKISFILELILPGETNKSTE